MRPVFGPNVMASASCHTADAANERDEANMMRWSVVVVENTTRCSPICGLR